MQTLIALLVPVIVCAALLYGAFHGVDVFSVFLTGVRKGLSTVLAILPTMIAMLTVITMLRASGAVDLFSHALAPFFALFGIPEACAPLTLLKPISGGGGLALGTEIMRTYGVDSYAGRVAAVMLGASETSVYTISVYFGAVKVSDIRYTLFCALCADAVAFAASALAVRLFF